MHHRGNRVIIIKSPRPGLSLPTATSGSICAGLVVPSRKGQRHSLVQKAKGEVELRDACKTGSDVDAVNICYPFWD